jgi:Helix-hairpin-helix motif
MLLFARHGITSAPSRAAIRSYRGVHAGCEGWADQPRHEINSHSALRITLLMRIVQCVILCSLFVLGGCTPKGSSPEAVREHAADATAEVKRDAKAIAQGVHEGWTRDSSVDINSASRGQLETLSGVTPKIAESIVSHRPYVNPSDLVKRHILSKPAYDKIADRLKAKS